VEERDVVRSVVPERVHVVKDRPRLELLGRRSLSIHRRKRSRAASGRFTKDDRDKSSSASESPTAA
jgi:hypothetical protein